MVFLHSQRKWQCKSVHGKRQFSAKVGTLFEDSPIPLEKWLVVVWMISNCRNGVSSYEIARTIGVTQKSAWFMLHRIRLGCRTNEQAARSAAVLTPLIEIDETFIGGRARNMHKSRRQRMTTVGKYTAKTAVMGILERGGKVRANVLGQRDVKKMREIIRETSPKASIMTDEFPGYIELSNDCSIRSSVTLTAM